MLSGAIESFNDARGDGCFAADGERFYFHCVNITDGSRLIAEGSSARARRIVGHTGHDEVADVQADS